MTGVIFDKNDDSIQITDEIKMLSKMKKLKDLNKYVIDNKISFNGCVLNNSSLKRLSTKPNLKKIIKEELKPRRSIRINIRLSENKNIKIKEEKEEIISAITDEVIKTSISYFSFFC